MFLLFWDLRALSSTTKLWTWQAASQQAHRQQETNDKKNMSFHNVIQQVSSSTVRSAHTEGEDPMVETALGRLQHRTRLGTVHHTPERQCERLVAPAGQKGLE